MNDEKTDYNYGTSKVGMCSNSVVNKSVIIIKELEKIQKSATKLVPSFQDFYEERSRSLNLQMLEQWKERQKT